MREIEMAISKLDLKTDNKKSISGMGGATLGGVS